MGDEEELKLKEGLQMIYVPTHTRGDVGHEDCERGFVMSVTENGASCRYWLKSGIVLPEITKKDTDELRTKANSENTPKDCIVIQEEPFSHSQEMVDALITLIKAGWSIESALGV